jgi:dihydroflavonol-4-reductase
MRVLITGGTGFVGSHTVAAVSRAGHAVRLLVRPQTVQAAALPPDWLAASPARNPVIGTPAKVTNPDAAAPIHDDNRRRGAAVRR